MRKILESKMESIWYIVIENLLFVFQLMVKGPGQDVVQIYFVYFVLVLRSLNNAFLMINWYLSVSRDKQDTELLIPCYVYKARAILVQY